MIIVKACFPFPSPANFLHTVVIYAVSLCVTNANNLLFKACVSAQCVCFLR